MESIKDTVSEEQWKHWNPWSMASEPKWSWQGADLKPLNGHDKTKSFEAVGVVVIADNMWTFSSMDFDVHKTRVAYIEMSLSQVLERISGVPFH